MRTYNEGTKSKRKPHNDLAGYIFERKHPRGHIVCLDAREAGIDVEDRYVVTIEGEQSAIGPSFTALPKARAFVKSDLAGESGYDWGFDEAESAAA